MKLSAEIYLRVSQLDPPLLELLGKVLQLFQLDIFVGGQLQPRAHLLPGRRSVAKHVLRRAVGKCHLWRDVGGLRTVGNRGIID
jgi:hypothetical protein